MVRVIKLSAGAQKMNCCLKRRARSKPASCTFLFPHTDSNLSMIWVQPKVRGQLRGPCGIQTFGVFLRDCLFSPLNWSEAHQPFTQFLAKFKTDLTFITLFLHPSIQLSHRPLTTHMCEECVCSPSSSHPHPTHTHTSATRYNGNFLSCHVFP